MVGPGRGSRGRGQAGRGAPRGGGSRGGRHRVWDSVGGPSECWAGGGPERPGLRARCSWSPWAEAPAAAGGGRREDRRARAPCARSRREAAGGWDAMSMEDPFFVVKGEVQKAVNTAQGLFQRWTELLQDPSTATREEIDWTTNELRNNLRSIEWDLEDLDETISIVEANPRKFNLDATELSIRKSFITSTRQVVRDMKDQMSASSVQALAERKNRQALLGDSGGGQKWSTGTPDKYGRLDRELQLANSHFIEEQQAQQQLIVEQQDEQLELVSGSIGVLKNMSQRIGGELEEQAVMLDDFSHELESTQSRLDNVMKKLAKVSHMTSDRRQWCAIAILFAVLLVVLLLFLVL